MIVDRPRLKTDGLGACGEGGGAQEQPDCGRARTLIIPGHFRAHDLPLLRKLEPTKLLRVAECTHGTKSQHLSTHCDVAHCSGGVAFFIIHQLIMRTIYTIAMQGRRRSV